MDGGYKNNDGIFRFKSSFSKDYDKFYLGMIICNIEIYDCLISLKSNFKLNDNYFPVYRQVLSNLR